MQLEERIQFIKGNLLKQGSYGCTLAARDCLLIIEVAFRELLRRHASKLSDKDQQKLQTTIANFSKGSRATGIENFTLGQLIGVIREAKFFDAWSAATGKPLTSIRFIELNQLVNFRNDRLVHVKDLEELTRPDLQITASEAKFLIYCLEIILETFGIESLENPPQSLPLEISLSSVLLRNPYRGLAAFRAEDVDYFFGREQDSQELLQLIEKNSFVALIGNSGSGKSSLVFAGVVPHLKNHWLIASCRPQNKPFYNLAETLVDALYQKELNESQRLLETKAFSEQFEQSNLTPLEAVQRILKKTLKSRLLLVIDQFEELFAQNPQPEGFLESILSLVHAESPAVILITLRADFMSAALAYPKFAQVLDVYPKKLLSTLNNQALVEIIEKPAEKVGLKLEEGLTERILQEIGDNQGNLPLLEFALDKLWNDRRQHRLTHESYEMLGGVNQALANYAKEVLQGFNPEGQQRLRQILVQMVHPGEGTEDTRQTVLRSQLSPDDWALVTQLADQRLVITGRHQQTGQETVELIHEALLKHWQTLRNWMTEDRVFRVWQERIRADLKEYQLKQEDRDLLLRGARLIEAEENLEKWQSRLVKPEIDFIHLSLKHRQQEIAEKLKQQRRLKVLTAAALLIAIVAGFFYFKAEEQTEIALNNESKAKQQETIAQNNAQQAIQEKQNALEQRNEALKTQSLFLAGLSRQELEKGDSTIATLLALEGLPTQWNNEGNGLDRPFVHQVVDSLYSTLIPSYKESFVFQHGKMVRNAIFSSNGQQILTISNVAKLWDAKIGKLLQIFTPNEYAIYYANFRSNNEQVITISDSIKLWDTQTSKLLQTFQPNGFMEHVAFSYDNNQILTASYSGEVTLWDIKANRKLKVLQHEHSHEHSVEYADFSPNGTQVISASNNKAILWDIQTGKQLKAFQHQNKVKYTVFSPDGKQIVTVSNDATITLWNAKTGILVQTLRAKSSPQDLQYVKKEELIVKFSSDGKQILTVISDKAVTLWDVQSGKILGTLQNEFFVKCATFSPTNEQIIISSGKTAVLWDIQTSKVVQTFQHQDLVKCAVFSFDSKQIATISEQAAALWADSASKILQTLQHKKYVEHAIFSNNGEHILSSSIDNTATLWDIQTGDQLKTFQHKDKVKYAAFSPDNKEIITISGKTATLWDVQTGNQLKTFQHQDEVKYAVFAPNNKQIITISDYNTTTLWNIETSDISQVYQYSFVVFSPDGKKIVSTYGNIATLWDAQTGNQLQSFQHDKELNGVVFSPNNKQIIAISNNTAILWDIQTGNQLKTFQHEKELHKVVFSPSGKHIITAMRDFDNNVAKLWDVQSGEVLQNFRHGNHGFWINCIDFSSDGQQILTASGNTIKLWKLFSSPQELINYAKEQLPLIIDGENPPRRRTLTCEERQRFFLTLPKECTAVSTLQEGDK